MIRSLGSRKLASGGDLRLPCNLKVGGSRIAIMNDPIAFHLGKLYALAAIKPRDRMLCFGEVEKIMTRGIGHVVGGRKANTFPSP